MNDLPLSLRDVIDINRKVTNGVGVVTDAGKIESALARPFHTFDQKPLYSTVSGQAGALLEGLVAAHGFSDGNKRSAWIAVKTFLRLSGIRPVKVPHTVSAEFVEGVAEHRYSGGSEVAEWLVNNMFPR